MSFGSPFGLSPYAAYGDATSARVTAAKAPKIVDGDTVRDADGNLEDALEPLDEEIAFFLGTAPGSFFGVKSLGNGALRMYVRRKTSEIEIRDHVRRALTPMLERGDIVDLTVTPQPVTRNGTAINYYDVTYRKTGLLRR